MISGRPVLFLGGSDWWLHNRVTEHHWAAALARGGHRVLFVNSVGIGLARPTTAAVWRRIGRKLTSYLRWLRRVDERLWVASPLTIPFWSISWVSALNERLLAVQLRLAMRIVGMRDPVISASIPTARVVLDRLDHAACVYFLMDNYSEYYEPMAFTVVREHDHAMREVADVVVCSSIGLFREVSAQRRDVEWIPHGVNPVFLEGPGDTALPTVLDQIPAPRIVYWGQLDVGVDAELLERIARSRRDWQLVLIGPVCHDFGALAQLPNVHFPGRLRAEALVAAAEKADVLIMPWKESPWTRYSCPIKFREYLATGKPIVSVPIVEVEEACGNVARIASGAAEWIEALEAAVVEKDEELAARRRAAVAGYDIRASTERFRSALARAIRIASPHPWRGSEPRS